MKTSIVITIALCWVSTLISAQTPVSPTTATTPTSTFGKEITTTIEKNLEIKPKHTGVFSSCNPLGYVEEFDLKELVPDAKKFDEFINKIDFNYGNRLQGLQLQLALPPNTTLDDVAIDLLGKAKNFAAFVKKFTGSEVYDLGEKDQNLLLDYYINHPIKQKPNVHVKGKKFIKSKKRSCIASSSTELKLIEWKSYPKLKWDLITTITIVCDCEEQPPTDLSEGTVAYKAEIRSTRTNNNIQLIKSKLWGPFETDAECCGMEEEYVEEDEDGEPTGPIQEYTPPQQTLGGSAGIGFSQDFDETNYCIGLEYLYKLTEFGNNPFYVGAHASYGGLSFNGNDSSLLQLGLSVQLFSQLSEYLNKVHITNGIMAHYLIGSQTNGGIKDDSNGYSVTVHSGLNIPINENVSISLFVPVLSYQNVTFSNDNNMGEVTITETTLLINKNNPLRVGVRFRL